MYPTADCFLISQAFDDIINSGLLLLRNDVSTASGHAGWTSGASSHDDGGWLHDQGYLQEAVAVDAVAVVTRALPLQAGLRERGPRSRQERVLGRRDAGLAPAGAAARADRRPVHAAPAARSWRRGCPTSLSTKHGDVLGHCAKAHWLHEHSLDDRHPRASSSRISPRGTMGSSACPWGAWQQNPLTSYVNAWMRRKHAIALLKMGIDREEQGGNWSARSAAPPPLGRPSILRSVALPRTEVAPREAFALRPVHQALQMTSGERYPAVSPGMGGRSPTLVRIRGALVVVYHHDTALATSFRARETPHLPSRADQTCPAQPTPPYSLSGAPVCVELQPPCGETCSGAGATLQPRYTLSSTCLRRASSLLAATLPLAFSYKIAALVAVTGRPAAASPFMSVAVDAPSPAVDSAVSTSLPPMPVIHFSPHPSCASASSVEAPSGTSEPSSSYNLQVYGEPSPVLAPSDPSPVLASSLDLEVLSPLSHVSSIDSVSPVAIT